MLLNKALPGVAEPIVGGLASIYDNVLGVITLLLAVVFATSEEVATTAPLIVETVRFTKFPSEDIIYTTLKNYFINIRMGNINAKRFNKIDHRSFCYDSNNESYIAKFVFTVRNIKTHKVTRTFSISEKIPCLNDAFKILNTYGVDIKDLNMNVSDYFTFKKILILPYDKSGNLSPARNVKISCVKQERYVFNKYTNSIMCDDKKVLLILNEDNNDNYDIGISESISVDESYFIDEIFNKYICFALGMKSEHDFKHLCQKKTIHAAKKIQSLWFKYAKSNKKIIE